MKLDQVRIAMKILLANKEYDDLLKEFAKEKYESKFRDMVKTHPDTWQSFKNYQIISDNMLRVNYQYGFGDMEMEGHFLVEL